jgi:CRP/FNR family transcriptional regulator
MVAHISMHGNIAPALHSVMGGFFAPTRDETAIRPAGAARDGDADPLNKLGEVRLVERDQVIFSEGSTAVAVHRVISGVIRLYKLLPDGRRQIIGFLRAGDMMGLAVRDRHVYTAEAVVTATLRRIPRAHIDALMDEQPATARRLLAAMTTELMTAQDQMVLLGRKTAREKLASFLLAHCGRPTAQGRCIDLPMSRTDIADYLGLTMETVSREFTKLKTARLIRLLEGGKVELLDLDTLSDMAECA